MNSNLNFKNSL